MSAISSLMRSFSSDIPRADTREVFRKLKSSASSRESLVSSKLVSESVPFTAFSSIFSRLSIRQCMRHLSHMMTTIARRHRINAAGKITLIMRPPIDNPPHRRFLSALFPRACHAGALPLQREHSLPRILSRQAIPPPGASLLIK